MDDNNRGISEPGYHHDKHYKFDEMANKTPTQYVLCLNDTLPPKFNSFVENYQVTKVFLERESVSNHPISLYVYAKGDGKYETILMSFKNKFNDFNEAIDTMLEKAITSEGTLNIDYHTGYGWERCADTHSYRHSARRLWRLQPTSKGISDRYQALLKECQIRHIWLRGFKCNRDGWSYIFFFTHFMPTQNLIFESPSFPDTQSTRYTDPDIAMDLFLRKLDENPRKVLELVDGNGGGRTEKQYTLLG